MSVIVEDPPIVFVHIPKTAGTSITRAFHDAGVSSASRLFKDGDARTMGYHPTAARIKAGLMEAGHAELYDDGHVFTVVRHPFDRMLSFWLYGRKRLHPCPFRTFSEFIRFVVGEADVDCSRAWHRARDSQLDYLDARVDVVIRFENLSASWARFVKRHGLPARMQLLPKMKQSRHGPWWCYYTATDAERLRRHARRELDEWNYGLGKLEAALDAER